MDHRYSQPESIPPLPQNAHSYSGAPARRPQRPLPYPLEDTMGPSRVQYAPEPVQEVAHGQAHGQAYGQAYGQAPGSPRSPPGPRPPGVPALHPAQSMPRMRPRVAPHARSDSAGSSHSLRSSVVLSKPAPKRHYIWESTLPQHQQLTINQFEGIRRAAQQRSHEPTVQLEYAKRLVEAASQLAARYSDPMTPSTILCDKRTEQKNREVWTATALKITKKLVSRANIPDALYFLAQNYSAGGMGLDLDNVKAFELYYKAAKCDHPEACYRLAVSYELGVGTRPDTERAFVWYKRAAPLNEVKSMYKLGMTFLNGGLGQQRNFSEALTWLQRAADKADPDTPHAVHELGLLFEHPRADALQQISRDYARAFDYFSKAAALGYTPSQVRLGRAFEFGELDRAVDSPRAMEWYTVAAKAGDPDAELGLSGFHWTGIEGFLRASPTEAFLWAERAAQKSNPRAEFALGIFYQYGVGVPVDLEKARQWYQRAHEKRHQYAAVRLRELRERERGG